MGDGLNMPSVPSRLAAVCACAVALSLTTPAVADKGGDESPPPQPAGLGAPGSQSGGSDTSAPPAEQPAAQAPSNSGGSSSGDTFTQKVNKGKGHSSPSLNPQRHGGSGNGS